VVLKVSFKLLEVKKLYPLAISRGSMSSSTNLFVFLTDGKHIGIGELSPATLSTWTSERGQAQIEKLASKPLPENPFDLDVAMRKSKMDPPAMAALDMALWDLLGKQAGLPLYALLGLPKRSVPTSVTIGLNPPDVTRARVSDILKRSGAKALKVKLGSPEGLDHDKEHFTAAWEAAKPFDVAIRVDANGGWTVDQTRHMMKWLWDRDVEYLEQPLPEGFEHDLPAIYANRKLPIFCDESVRTSADVPKLAGKADGINLKLMKSGGITEALRIVATARANKMQTMIGCMSETSIAIAAGAAIGALFDHIDLDSHLNLDPDPATGAPIIDGVITPTDNPGHGASLIDA